MSNTQSFDTFVLLTSIPSEIDFHHILTFIIHTNIHLRKFVGNICCLYEKQI